MPRALLLSVAIVAAIYIAVTLGAQMLVSDHTIVANKEVAFVAVGQAALGEFGRWAAIAGALLATSSAINATLFSAARLVRDASEFGELPSQLGRERNGLPLVALGFISVVGTAMAMLPGITAIIAVGSGSFLAVYTLVNYLQARAATRRAERVLAWVAASGAIGAIGVLLYELARDDRWALGLLGSIAALLAAGRLAFRRRAAAA